MIEVIHAVLVKARECIDCNRSMHDGPVQRQNTEDDVQEGLMTGMRSKAAPLSP